MAYWLLLNQSFCAWHTLEDRTAEPALSQYGNLGVGKTYISMNHSSPSPEYNAKKPRRSLVTDTRLTWIDGEGEAVACVTA